jgi:hypothetical protein
VALMIMFIYWPASAPLHCRCQARFEEGLDESWAKENFDGHFGWQEGYAAFTVSPSATDAVRSYVANQEQHHGKHSFVDELKDLLRKAGVMYDGKYLL